MPNSVTYSKWTPLLSGIGLGFGGGGAICDHIMSTRIFTLIMNKIFI